MMLLLVLLVLLAACSVGPLEPREPLPQATSLEGLELRLPAGALVVRAAHAQLDEADRGRAQQVTASVERGPGLSIQSEQASWDLKGQTVVFEGEVQAVRGAFTLACQRLEARFDSPEALRTALATGEVQVVHGERVATGERAELDVPSGRLELSGSPVLREGGRSLRGERLVLFLDDERLECQACTLEIAADESAVVPASP